LTSEHLFARVSGVQRSFDDLGTALRDTTFVVIDLETTGGSPAEDAITEIGAVKVRGGEVQSTFATLVNPGRAVPAVITLLTGISEAMVAKAPRIEAVLGSLVDFVGDAVVVGHNVRFDLGFLAAALERDGRAPLTNRRVDTVALARRLVRDEVPNCRLSTLAERLRRAHRPNHRALDDALATADLLHVLIERAGGLGVTGLEDLLLLPTVAGHPQATKLRLTERLPRRPGVYLFRTAGGHVLYVGKATDLRSRVRSYFSSDERRKVGSLLRETGRIDHKVCPSTLEAAVLEARLIRQLTPPYNSQGTRWRTACYLRLTDERFPRLSIVGDARPSDSVALGPLRSRAAARLVAEAIESAIPLRRCTARVPARPTRTGPCAPAQLGVACCPCTGEVSEDDYSVHVRAVQEALGGRHDLLFDPLERQMLTLADQERYEEAALVRDRLAALSGALHRRRQMERLVGCERLLLEAPGGEGLELRRGVLWAAWCRGVGGATVATRSVEMRPDVLPEPGRPVPKAIADELLCVAAWLERHGAAVRLEHVEGVLAEPLNPLRRYAPTR
jgi:DNA polymerase-3 subunit epsilon